MQIANSELYRTNLFRILGLPVNASPKDVQRRETRRKMEAKLGRETSGGLPGLLALDPPPDEDAVRRALERLNRPIDRFLNEIFWIWPYGDDPSGGEAWRALISGDSDAATEIWIKDNNSGEGGPAPSHNLSVLHHLKVLDYELQVKSGRAECDAEHMIELWVWVFARWKETLSDETFWDALRSRVLEINDAQLTTGIVRRIRTTLPTALLLINAKLALSAAERGDSETGRRHMEAIRRADLGEGLAEEALRQALQGPRDHLNAAIETARKAWTTSPQRGNKAVRDLHAQAKRWLTVIDAMLPEEDAIRRGLHDLVGDAILDGQLVFGKKTDDWNESIELLKLAQAIALGDPLKTRLTETIDVLKNNAKSGNDWCSPGYWELADQIVEQLEEARGHTRSGNYEKAIALLSGMRLDLGRPVLRCASFALSQRGWQIANEAIGEFTKPTTQLQKFLDVIGRRGSISIPNSYMSSWQLPECPVCDSRYYTSWLNGEYNGQKFWMCASCGERSNSERERRKSTLSSKLTDALGYLKLASEIDPAEKTISEDIKKLEEIGSSFSVRTPSTKALRTRLGTDRTTRVAHQFPADDECFFCNENRAEDASSLRVAMSGDPKTTALVFGTGTEYRYGDLRIPRCRRCRSEHMEHPVRVVKWRQMRAAAASEETLSAEHGAVKKVEKTLAEYQKIAVAWQAEIRRAATASQEARAIGQRCMTCNSSDHWHSRHHLCRKCDGSLFQLGLAPRAGVAALGVTGIALTPMFAHAIPLWLAAAVPVFASVMPFVALKRSQFTRRKVLGDQRRADDASRQEAAAASATGKMETAIAGWKVAHDAESLERAKMKNAIEVLKEAVAEAVSDFDRSYPEPKLMEKVRPESDFETYAPLTELRAKGWTFGHSLDGRGDISGVEGLVGAKEEPAKPEAEGTPPVGRAAVLALARNSKPGDIVACPLCTTKVKAGNLVRHYDKSHPEKS